MRRPIFSLLAAFSLLLWAAGMALCVRSTWVADQVAHYERLSDTQVSFTSDRGRLSCWATHYSQRPLGWMQGWSSAPAVTHYPLPGGWSYLGFYIWYAGDRVSQGLNLILPYWFVLCLLAILPSRWLWLAAHPQAAPAGLCAKCGYDLRASKERCPECGTPVPGDRANLTVPPEA